LGYFASTDVNYHGTQIIVPETLILSNLTVGLTVAPGTGSSYVFTIYQAASPTAPINPTSLTATIAGAALTASNNVNTVTFNPFETIVMVVTPSSSPTPNEAIALASVVVS